jgi:uncharacterized protein (TIGR02266 family)
MSRDPIAPRRHQRVPVRVPVRVSTIDSEVDARTGRPFFRASREWCANVSRGGVYVRSSEPLTPGRRVLVEIELPDGTPIEATGRVAWTRRVLDSGERDEEAGIGIEFLGANGRAVEALEAFLGQSAPTPRGDSSR